MKRAQVIGISIAFGAAALAFFIAKGFMKPAPAPIVQTEKIDAVPVLVAKQDIGLGIVATAQSFRWQDWPKEAVSQHFITRPKQPNAINDFAGTIARSPLLTGEPITASKLVKVGSGGVLSAMLPPGFRAVSTKITEHSAVGKMILPNDYVDVMLVSRGRSRGGQEDISTETLFRNIRVLAIGQQIEVKEGRKNAEGNVATLELTPGQAEILAQANSKGEITLALRSIADINTSQSSAEDRAKDRTNSVRVLRYGLKQKSYGVN